jgi:hypothetical protein
MDGTNRVSSFYALSQSKTIMFVCAFHSVFSFSNEISASPRYSVLTGGGIVNPCDRIGIRYLEGQRYLANVQICKSLRRESASVFEPYPLQRGRSTHLRVFGVHSLQSLSR